MKKLIFGFIAISILINYACSNEFDLIEDWQDIPVVYGLLSPADTAHYIRVEKAFIDPSTSALDIAQIPDSLYYEDISVEIEKVATEERFTLTRVDGNQEGYVRESGIFADAPNYLYKVKLNDADELEGGATYRLIVNRGDDLPEVTAETIIVGDMTIATPVTTVKFENGRTTNFRWNVGDDVLFFDLTLRLNYLENTEADPNVFVDKTIEWPIARNILKDDIGAFGEYKNADGEDFFRFIANELRDAPDRIRDFKTIDMVVTGGDQNLFDYVNIGQANTGITSSQEIPSFTNLSEGIGLFGSTNRVEKIGLTLTTETEDSLRFGIHTKDLNFQ